MNGTTSTPSYASGTSDVPLLGDTIGQVLDRVAAEQPDAPAMVEVGSGRRWTYAELRDAADEVALGSARALASTGVTGSASGPPTSPSGRWCSSRTAKIGAILVNINPAYRVARAGVRAEASRHLAAGGRAELQDAPTTPAMIDEVRPDCPELRQVVLIGRPEWDELLAAGRAGDRDELARRQAELSADDPINIQYTSGTTGFPKGATLSHHNIVNNGYFVGRLCGYTPDDRVCIPVPFYHCFGMVMGNLGAVANGATMVIPAPGLRPRRDPARGGHRTLHLAVRGADHVHRRARRPRLRRLRPDLAAHRDHGRLAVPGRGDEAGRRPDGDDRGDHLLRHDGDLAGVHPDPRRRLAGPAGLHGRPGAPACRGQDRRPGHRPHPAPRRAGRAVHPRLLGDARLLGAAGEDGRGRSTPPAGCTPATSR